MASVTLAQMRAVDALARTGSFSRAAEAVGVSQPTVSTQVQAFQDLCSSRVFIREGHAIRVTADGEALLAKIRVALNCVDEVDRALGDSGRLVGGQLSIGFSAHRLIMPALATFVQAFPKMRLSTRGGPSLELASAVFKGELDVASVSQAGPDPRFENLELRRCGIVIYGKKGHPLLAAGTIAVSDLHRQDMILWNRASGTRMKVEALAAQQGVVLKPVVEVATLDVAYAAAAAGMGLAVAIEGEVSQDEYIDIALLSDQMANIGHYIIALPSCTDHVAIAAFLKIAAQHRFIASGATPRGRDSGLPEL